MTAAIELLVGAACVALAWPWWRRGGMVVRLVGGALALAGIVAIVNAVMTLVEG